MSDQPANKDATTLEINAGKQPVQEAASASSQQVRDEGQGKTRGPAHPLINPNANLEAYSKRTFHEMIDLNERDEREESEKVAYILLSHGNCPVLYRCFAHMILAHGLEDCLLHAEKAVEVAEWGMSRFGDDKGAASQLLATAQSVLGEVKARVVQEEEEMQEVGPAAGESAQGQGQESAATLDAPGGTTSANTSAPRRTTSDNTAGPSKITAITITVPSRTTSGNTAGDMEPKKHEKRDYSGSATIPEAQTIKTSPLRRRQTPDRPLLTIVRRSLSSPSASSTVCSGSSLLG